MASPPEQMTKFSPDQERALLTYAQRGQELLLNQFSLRTHLEKIDRAYMRENNRTEAQLKAKAANRAGDAHKIQDITVPVVMPQVEAALGYMCNVFVTGYPTFGVSAAPQLEDAAMQMETIIAENSTSFAWARQLIMFFRDGLKYNFHGLECEWQQRTVGSIETDIKFANSAKPKTVLKQGNCLRRLDPYNTFFDPRVHPAEIHSEGEYAGYLELYSRIRLKKFINDLYGKIPAGIAIRAFESAPVAASGMSSGSPFSYYTPLLNPSPLMDTVGVGTFDWMAWATAVSNKATTTLRYSNVYQVTKLYARILPSDFDLRVPEANTPQIWKFYIVNGQVILWAERQTNAHNFIPMFFGQPLEDGLDYQTKSFASNVSDMQDIASAMWNGYIASKRRLVGDRVLYDPLRVREKDINSTNPAAKIPVRPSAYGKPVGEAVYQFPYRDEATQSMLDGAERVVRYANLVNNQNPAQQGQFVKGNKTKHEYDDIMGHGNSHNQKMALTTEAQIFTPMKECIKLNILQYQPEEVIFNQQEGQQVAVKPEELRKTAVQFKVSDGLTPTDKLMSTDEFMTALQVIGSSPQIGQAYNISPLVTYLFKQRGADLRPFEKPQVQVMYEQQLAAWQQAAAEAAKAGQQFSTPQPQIPQQLQNMRPGQAQPSATSTALAATQGS